MSGPDDWDDDWDDDYFPGEDFTEEDDDIIDGIFDRDIFDDDFGDDDFDD